MQIFEWLFQPLENINSFSSWVCEEQEIKFEIIKFNKYLQIGNLWTKHYNCHIPAPFPSLEPV